MPKGQRKTVDEINRKRLNKTRVRIAKRLKRIRQEQINENGKPYTQKDFCNELNYNIIPSGARHVSLSALSSWELGLKLPPVEVLEAIANYYGLSMDFMFGRESENEHGIAPQIAQEGEISIPYESLKEFDGKPVYLEFTKAKKKPCWGIYNADTDCFSCRDELIKNKDTYNFYTVAPETMKKVIKKKDVTFG